MKVKVAITGIAVNIIIIEMGVFRKCINIKVSVSCGLINVFLIGICDFVVLEGMFYIYHTK